MKKIDVRFQKYHTTLSAKAKELDLRIDGLGEPLPPHDQGDLANGSVAKEMAAAFQDIRTKLAFLIRLAIERMQQGVYDTCLNCEEEIPPRRLEAVPWTPFCAACQDRLDKGKLADYHQYALPSPALNSRSILPS
ncbi:MAG: TraR/DksA family transcriptional regulator [Patescibacteria group bacterium]|nr:TraR/DksA family transcriptional regulator [Patescibacteria group bacterium]